nr:putative f-box/kelch-repeat protein [Quercus suber]
MDPMEEEVEENIGWGSLDDLDGEYEICICAQKLIDEVRCYTIKAKDISNFTPKNLTPFSVATPKGPCTSRYFALLNNHLYSAGGYLKIPTSELEDVIGPEDYCPLNDIYMPSRFVWTLDLTCPDLGWKQLDEPMKNRRKDPQTIVVDGKLYVFGGLYGYEPILEDRSSGRGWMEVYDPILETWESLPNPPCSDIRSLFDEIVYAHLELEEDKHEIMVVDLSNSKENNMQADFLKYNVVSSRWETWLQQQWVVVISDIQCGRAVVVDHTKAYWASIESMANRNECSIYGFDLESKLWAYQRLNPTPFLGDSEYFCWISPGLLHLSDHKFCLLLSSHKPAKKDSNFLFCFVLDLSAFFDTNGQYADEPPLYVLSIQKYSLDTGIDLLDCMITNRGTQPPNKKKPKTSEEGSVTTEDH